VASLDLQRRLDLHPAALVERQPEACVRRVRSNAGSPDDGARLDSVAVGQHSGVLLHRLERRADPDVHAAPLELPRDVAAREAAADHERAA
jgi:hypothetical protein